MSRTVGIICAYSAAHKNPIRKEGGRVFQQVLSVVAGVLFLVGFVPYILAILKGQTKPMKASWLIWASLDTITLAGMYAKGTVNGQMLGACTGAWVIVLLAFRYGVPGWSKLDFFCLGGAVLGVLLWVIFQEPTLGIITSVIVIVLGSFPTFSSAWKDPSREDRMAWTIFFLSCVAAMFAIPAWTLADAAPPVAFTAIETTMMYLLWVLPMKKQ